MVRHAMHAERHVSSQNTIQIDVHMGMGRTIFETDRLNLKHAMMTSHYSSSPIIVLITDMKFRFQINFIEARMMYVPRVCNKHDLVALGVGEFYEGSKCHRRKSIFHP